MSSLPNAHLQNSVVFFRLKSEIKLAVNKKLYDYYYYFFFFFLFVFRKIGNLDNVAAPIFVPDHCNNGCPSLYSFTWKGQMGGGLKNKSQLESKSHISLQSCYYVQSQWLQWMTAYEYESHRPSQYLNLHSSQSSLYQ